MIIQSHKDKWRQQQAGHQPPVSTSAPREVAGPDYPMMLVSLGNDVERLHTLNSLQRKQAVKREELIPRYRDYLTKHMSHERKPGAVLVRVMIWAFDVMDLNYGMRLATYAYVQGGAVMPEGFKRDFANYALGTVGDIAVSQMTNKQPITDHITTVAEWMHDHPEWDIVDKIRAAVLKGEGGWLEQNAALESALICYEQAQALDSGVNLRRKIKQLKGEASSP